MSGRRGALHVAAAVALAALLLDGGVVRHRALAGPLAIGRAIAAAVRDGTLVSDVSATLRRTGLGVALGLLVGVTLAMAARRSRAALEGPLDFLRAIPPLLVVPLLCFAFGYGELARTLAVAWAAALAVSLHVSAALARPEGERERALRAMGATPGQILWHVRARELVPSLLLGLRQAAATGLVVCVVTDMMLGADAGLGARALAAQIAYDTPGVWAVMVVTGALGLGIGSAILALERRVEHWRAA